MQTFKDFALRATTLAALRRMNYQTPTPVQAQTIPLLMQGRDLLAQARTGTGKTAAFGVPLVDELAAVPETGVLGLILVPTRELALQVAEVLEQLAYGTDLFVVPIFGGTGYGNQDRALRSDRPLIVVATPGRLLDHMQRRTIRLGGVIRLVLDEADRMLDMGFRPDVERILGALPRQRQTSLLSATIPDDVERLARRFMNNPTRVRIEAGPATVPDADQFQLRIQGEDKSQTLERVLRHEQPERAIVFTRTKHRARRLAKSLSHGGWKAVALQGNMTQGQRERALDDFRSGKARLLVATDVASRGLDVPEVSHVVNFDVPREPEAYVHRIGRTARNGRKGRAITFIGSDEARELRALESAGGTRLQIYRFAPENAQPVVAPSGQSQVVGLDARPALA